MQEGSNQREMNLGIVEQGVLEKSDKIEVQNKYIGGEMQQAVLEGEEFVKTKLQGGTNMKTLNNKQEMNGGKGGQTKYTSKSRCREHGEILSIIRSKYLKRAKKMSAKLNQEQKKEKIKQSKIIVSYL